MTDPVPSKERVAELEWQVEETGRRNAILGNENAALEQQLTEARRENVRWENAHKILLAEVERLKREIVRITGEREPPHCVTCECGLVDVGRAEQESEPVRVHTGQPHVYGVVALPPGAGQ